MENLNIHFLPIFLLISFLLWAPEKSAVNLTAGKINGSHAEHPNPSSSFVQVKDGDFVLSGHTFRFVGTNAYYLPNYEKLDPNMVNRTLDAFKEAGITVVRMWGFYDGFDCGISSEKPTENVIQTYPGIYDENALRDLDRVIAKGKTRGIRFILTFINYWDELGGVCQYNTWDKAPNPSENMGHFINDPDTQRWFKKYISMLINRRNTVTGTAYKNETAIFSWEIMNEGRYKEKQSDPVPLRDWYREIAKYIKSQDPNHMVSTGEEGFETSLPKEYSVDQYSNTYVLRAKLGTSYMLNTAIPEIDYGSIHWYPSEWGFGHKLSPELLKAQRAWLDDHKKISDQLGKPFILGEYGFPGWGDNRVLTIYNDLWKYAEEIKLDGSLIWQFTPTNTKCYENGGNICWPEGRKDYQLYNGYVNHGNKMHSFSSMSSN